MIQSAKSFRKLGYLEPIQFSHIRGLYEKSYKLAEDGDLSIANRLVEICPRPEKGGLAQVKSSLKEKHLSRSWWGWDALGVGMSKRSELIQSFSRSRRNRKLVRGPPR